jgi:outer membrane scaffolding protein for murein synthesis (MipA/OmpV family)
MKISRILVLSLTLLLAASPVWAAKGLVGLGAGLAPDYEGSEDYKAIPMFMVNYNYDSGRFVKLMGTNLKVNLLADKQYSIGPVANYRMKRDNVDNNQVDDMDKVDAALELGGFAGVDVNNLLLGLEVLADVSDSHDGATVQATAGYRMKAMPELTFTPGVFLTYASDDYMDTYFSVTNHNKGNSNLSNYSADGGFKDVGLNLVASYTPWEKWGVMGLFSYKMLLNDAKDSPLVDDVGDKNQMTLGLMATYRWGN